MTYIVPPQTLADDAQRENQHREEPTWRQSFDALLARVQANSIKVSSDEIEADITAAAEEVKELRHLTVDMRDELERMTWLSDQDLWTIARSAMSARDQEQLRYLSELQSERSLTEDEAAKLDALLQAYGQVTLSKARAYALLSSRRGKPLLAEN